MKPEEVDNLPSRPFKGFDWSEHTAVSRLVDTLYAEYKAWYKGPGKRLRDPEKIKQHLTHFVLEAYRTHRALPELVMGVRLSKDYYNEYDGRYHPNHLSYRIVKHVTEFLEMSDYLELPIGVSSWHSDPRLRRTTRFRATQKLMDLCEDHGINSYMIVPYEDPEVIVLREKKKRGRSQGNDIDYTDTPFTRRASENLKRINKFIAAHHINLDITDDMEEELLLRLLNRDNPTRDRYLDFTRTRLSRIFNNSSFEQGGRFYGGWWQQIPGDYRHVITINSKRTVELDYSGMHFAIMYADLGLDIPMDDPYALDGYGEHLRGDIKKAFNIIINCTSRKLAVGTINGRIKDGKLSDELGDGEKLIQAFTDTHPLIKHKIASGEGVRGQFTDSQVAEQVLLKGIDIGLCILPIHDGFITTAGDEHILEGLMDKAFSEVTGHNANIKPETFDMSILPDAGDLRPYWVVRPDGTEEMNGPIEGKAISYSEIVSRPDDLWKKVMAAAEKMNNKNKRDKEWESVHGQ